MLGSESKCNRLAEARCFSTFLRSQSMRVCTRNFRFGPQALCSLPFNMENFKAAIYFSAANSICIRGQFDTVTH